MDTTSDSTADPQATTATAPEDARTEWEVLVAAVEVHLAGMAPTALKPQHVARIAEATGCEPAAVARFGDAHRVANKTGVSVEIVFALLHQGLPADAAALAACGETAHRSAVEGAIAAGGVPAGVREEAETGVKCMQQVAADQQPVALTYPETLYATTAAAAAGRSKLAKIVSARLEAALQQEVRDAIGRVGPELDRALHARIASLKWQENADRPVAEVADSLLADVGCKNPALAPETTAARNRMAAAPQTLVSDALHLHDPINENPLLHSDLARGKAVEHARLAGLGDEATRAVLERSAALADGDASPLVPLVANGSLEADDAAALRSVLELAKLTGDNLALMRVLDSRAETNPAALSTKSRADWETLLEERDIPLPPDQTTATYADAIVRNLESTFPTQALAARVEQGPARTFLANNAGVDLRYVDLVQGNDDALDWKGVAKKDRPAVRRELARLQRVLAIADGTEAQKQLLDRGFDSALKIARMPEREFMTKSGLSPAQAKATYVRSHEAALSVAHGYGAIRDTIGQFGDLAVGNVAPQLVNDLRQIDGFSDLFGSQDFCSCSSCQSVLSPAAYFCDLMHFVEQNVSRPVFITPGKTTHPLYLKTRRPDLWTLKLTCENTNTLVPYLTIVDEVLEAFLASIVGGDIYETLADPTDKVSFRVPFSLPFAELNLYLSHFGLGPADVYETLQLADSKVWRARLRLSPDEATVIVTADPAGVLTRLGTPSTLNDLDVQDFLRLTGLKREELDDVLALRSNTDMQAITVAEKKVPDELQNFAEILKGLNAARADFIHRYLRLKRATPWKLDELDLVLVALKDTGAIAGGLDDDVIEQLGQLVELQTALRLSAQELCAIPGALPVSAEYPLQPDRDAELLLYERLFDLPKLFGLADATTGELNQTATYRHYSLDTVNPTDTTIDPKTPLLLAGLGISETDLLLLFDLLKDELPFDANGVCTLNRPKLSLLYRHVRVGRALKLSVEGPPARARIALRAGRPGARVARPDPAADRLPRVAPVVPVHDVRAAPRARRRRGPDDAVREHARHGRAARAPGAGARGDRPRRGAALTARRTLQRRRRTAREYARLGRGGHHGSGDCDRTRHDVHRRRPRHPGRARTARRARAADRAGQHALHEPQARRRDDRQCDGESGGARDREPEGADAARRAVAHLLPAARHAPRGRGARRAGGPRRVSRGRHGVARRRPRPPRRPVAGGHEPRRLARRRPSAPRRADRRVPDAQRRARPLLDARRQRLLAAEAR